MLFNKDGDAICAVCGDFWQAHGLGGNCQKMPLTAQARQKVESIYKFHSKPQTQTTHSIPPALGVAKALGLLKRRMIP